MFRIEEFALDSRFSEYPTSSMLSSFSSDTGRLYFSSPNFCVDVSTSRVSGFLEARASSFSYSAEYFDRKRWMEDLRALRMPSPTFVLKFEFEMGSAAELVFPFQSVKRHPSPIIQMTDLGHTALLVDSTKLPKPVWRPIWLPGGVWQCAYCASSQLHDLLQCRNCGAPRYDDLRK